MKTKAKIKILSHNEALKIAAGEVVERPANIVKELLENAIDAQATKITLTVKKSGKRFISIHDNGTGMNNEDILLSVQNHATSKIKSVDDLETIATFGFRGEALCSIATVSNLTIISKTKESTAAHKINWNFGKLNKQETTAHQTGTTIIVENLFDNIPARQKFLKKDETEWRAIVGLFQAFNLVYPHIHFQLYNEDSLHLNCPAVHDVKTKTAQLWHRLHDNMIELAKTDNDHCTVTGLTSQISYYRYDRNQIFVFVNNRWIKNIDLTKAIMRGYAGTLPPQKFPAAAIFITMPTDQLDVNIHPKKEEVKFLHPRRIETAVTSAIKATLQQVTTQTTSSPIAQVNKPFTPQYTQPLADYSFSKTPLQAPEQNNLQPSEKIVVPPAAEHAFNVAPIQPAPQPMPIATPQKNETIINPEEELSINIIGQYKTTYILIEKNNDLILVDQHAAHERIIYENLKSNFKDVANIKLLFPETIKLQHGEVQIVQQHLALFKIHGIEIDIFSDDEIMVQATPVHMKNQKIDEMVKQIISWIAQSDNLDEERVTKQLHDKIHTKMACSTAIKAGEKLSHDQMHKLLQDLKKTPNNFSCPHGRPTHFVFQIDDIEKKFKRDYGQKAEQQFDFI